MDARKDKKMDHVILNESRDKKFKKYMVQELPHPFKSKEEFDAQMGVAVGKEWNTNQTFK